MRKRTIKSPPKARPRASFPNRPVIPIKDAYFRQEINMNEVMKWKDGSDVICEVCQQPIYSVQPMVATITHNIKKRHAKHFLFDGGTITVIGNNETTVFRKE